MWTYVTFILSALIAICGVVFKQKSVVWKVVLIALAVLLCIVQILAHKDKIEDNQRLKDIGILRSPSETILSTFQTKLPRLKLGNSNTFLDYVGNSGKLVINAFDDAGLVIWTENGHLKLSTKIRNRNGVLIAEILANEWKTKTDNRWDRNYNDHALEVKDGSGDIVLQVIIMDEYVQFAGKMFSANGDGFAIGSSIVTKQDLKDHMEGRMIVIASASGPKEYSVGDLTGTLEFRPNPPGDPLMLHIKPMFQYPGDRHLGEIINP